MSTRNVIIEHISNEIIYNLCHKPRYSIQYYIFNFNWSILCEGFEARHDQNKYCQFAA